MARILQATPILALDISSKGTGVALLYRGKLSTRNIVVDGDYSRVVKMGDMFLEFLQDAIDVKHYPEDRWWDVWVEQPFYSKGGSHDLPIKMTHGVMLYTFHLVGIKYTWNYVNVNTWRAPFKLNGVKDKKGPVMAAMSKRFGISVADDNTGDALGILDWRMKEVGIE